jgi:hypothetical protein
MRDTNKVLERMDLSDCKSVMFYGSGDISYVRDKQEYHLDIDDTGDVSSKPFREYQRELRRKQKEDRAEVKDGEDVCDVCEKEECVCDDDDANDANDLNYLDDSESDVELGDYYELLNK